MNKKIASIPLEYLEINIIDSLTHTFVDKEKLADEIYDKFTISQDYSLYQIDIFAIEKYLNKNPHIKKTEVFKTNNKSLIIEIEQKKPLIRIIDIRNNSYYLDVNKQIIPISNSYSAKVLIATGYIDRQFASSLLLDLSKTISEDKFLNSLIEQIYVRTDKTIELIPSIGDVKIILGKIDSSQTKKLEKLKKFYLKGVRKINLNLYSTINLEYNKQIVLTKK